MKCSIVMSTYADHESPWRPELLSRTLDSIRRQKPPFEFECIVVDDGSTTPEIKRIVTTRGFTYLRMDRPAEYRNPGPARNFGYRHASGEVVICQSDEVVHWSPKNVIERLVDMTDYYGGYKFMIATVANGQHDTCILPTDIYTGPQKPSPLFFLGAVHRRHIYAIGGNDEDFTEPGYDDNYFADCLIHGQMLSPVYSDEIIGIHQDHPRPSLRRCYKRMREIYERKFAYAKASGKWVATGGPWPMDRPTV